MNFKRKITKVETPNLFFNAAGKINFSKTTIKDLNNFSILHDVGFEFSSSNGKIKTLVLPSRKGEC